MGDGVLIERTAVLNVLIFQVLNTANLRSRTGWAVEQSAGADVAEGTDRGLSGVGNVESDDQETWRSIKKSSVNPD